MKQQDAQSTLQHHVEVWETEIANYIKKYSDNMIARQLLPVRKVGTDAEIDVVTEYNKRGGDLAQVAAKGTVPSGSGVEVSKTTHTIYQILDGFDLHEKDMSVDPDLKKRQVDVCTRNVHRAEDDLTVNGQSTLNLNGIADVVPSGNQISASENHGAWDGSEANDIHQDVLDAIGYLDTDFEPSWILGHPTDINYLNGLDSERQPYWKTIVDLFPGARSKEDFLLKSNRVSSGTVYIGVKDVLAAELVISEELTVASLPMQRGRVYPVEIYEWVVPEIHNDDCFASIVTS